ncbi:hypothetical protein F4818DRAFT_429632 [Hypoxylon cercidicola]|nr:hypothetical protein F4818DRAFT_429632 [Hypoxylon cercidicola]
MSFSDQSNHGQDTDIGMTVVNTSSHDTADDDLMGIARQALSCTTLGNTEYQVSDTLMPSLSNGYPKPIVNLAQPGEPDGSCSERWPARYSEEAVNQYSNSTFREDGPVFAMRDKHNHTAWALKQVEIWTQSFPDDLGTLLNLDRYPKRWEVSFCRYLKSRKKQFQQSPELENLAFASSNQIRATYGAIVGLVVERDSWCTRCTDGYGQFQHCIVISGQMSNSCVNCHYSGKGGACTIRQENLKSLESRNLSTRKSLLEIKSVMDSYEVASASTEREMKQTVSHLLSSL